MKMLKQIIFTIYLFAFTVVVHGEHVIDEASLNFSRAELDQMLAPIALYPDTVLSHILIASTYPLEVVKANRWREGHSQLNAEQAAMAVDSKSWDPSVKALVVFPEIIKRMNDDLDWTQRIGDAFLADEALVMDVIQGLRQRAYNAGSLKEMQYTKVYRENRVIIIEPSVERVVYVPYYDTREVYGGWWWPNNPPVYWSNHYSSRHVHVSNRFYWGPSIYVGSSFFISAFQWNNRHVVVLDTHYHHKTYTSRAISRNHNAKHWQHNPKHRGGIDYRNNHVRQRYRSEGSNNTPEFRSHVRKENPKAVRRDNPRETQKFHSTASKKEDDQRRDHDRKDKKNSSHDRKNDDKNTHSSKHRYSNEQQNVTREDRRENPPARHRQEKDEKEIRWKNTPPRHSTNSNGIVKKEKIIRQKNREEKKSNVRERRESNKNSGRSESYKSKRSDSGGTENKKLDGKKLSPRPASY
jgi:hypothetical protein